MTMHLRDEASAAELMREANVAWLTAASKFEHLYKHRWLGERFFHLPGDMVALQEIVWQVRPRTVIHTGVAAGGGPVFMASLLELVGGDGIVVAVDPRLRDEGRRACTEHALAKRIKLIEGDSIAADVVAAVGAVVKEQGGGPVLVVSDLDHRHDHVKQELHLLGELVTPGSFLVVLDTVMEQLPAEIFAGRPYGKGNNPGTAVAAFLAEDKRFVVDRTFEDRVLLTLAPGGFLRRLPD